MITEQSIFNHVAEFLIKQGKKSKNHSICLYRGPDNIKCAIGCLIPDGVYDPSMEGQGVDYLIDHYKVPAYFEQHLHFLGWLQNMHDYASNDDMLSACTDFALQHNLQMPRLPKQEGTKP